jgi:hypothetical protein
MVEHGVRALAQQEPVPDRGAIQVRPYDVPFVVDAKGSGTRTDRAAGTTTPLGSAHHRAEPVKMPSTRDAAGKHYSQRRLVRIKYQMCHGSRRALRAALRHLGWSGTLQTAFVERVNLTVRQSSAALTRRTWATAQTAGGLQHQVAWWRGYYHFVRPHLGLRQHGRACTPAMAAGLTTHRWTTAEFLGYPCAQTG